MISDASLQVGADVYFKLVNGINGFEETSALAGLD